MKILLAVSSSLQPIFFAYCIFLSQAAFSQLSISVYDFDTKEPIVGASVYYDGTTIGTATDSNGQCDLEFRESANARVIISFIGYETRDFRPEELREIGDVFLKPGALVMDELVFQKDSWSRSKKLGIFRKEFLGRTVAAEYCKIMNEDDLTLVYDPAKDEMLVFAKEPIIIRNKYLGYIVRYNLVDFIVKFDQDANGLRFVKEMYYAGTSFFAELRKKESKKYIKVRENSFNGSRLHFMRALSENQLVENQFMIFEKQLPVDPYAFLLVEKEGVQTKVTMLAASLGVLYNRDRQSSIEIDREESYFYVDDFGVFYPVDRLKFAGYFGWQRMADTLPQDYGL